jgi:hypothetical protein
LHVSVGEEVVDFVPEMINVSVIIISNPREKIVDGLFQGVFKLRSKRSATRPVA